MQPGMIEAMRYQPGPRGISLGCIKDLHDWAGSIFGFKAEGQRLSIGPIRDEVFISPGDWVVKDANGEFHPMEHEIFKKTYRRVYEFENAYAPRDA